MQADIIVRFIHVNGKHWNRMHSHPLTNLRRREECGEISREFSWTVIIFKFLNPNPSRQWHHVVRKEKEDTKEEEETTEMIKALSDLLTGPLGEFRCRNWEPLLLQELYGGRPTPLQRCINCRRRSLSGHKRVHACSLHSRVSFKHTDISLLYNK